MPPEAIDILDAVGGTATPLLWDGLASLHRIEKVLTENLRALSDVGEQIDFGQFLRPLVHLLESVPGLPTDVTLWEPARRRVRRVANAWMTGGTPAQEALGDILTVLGELCRECARSDASTDLLLSDASDLSSSQSPFVAPHRLDSAWSKSNDA
jgi:hypothetical protein